MTLGDIARQTGGEVRTGPFGTQLHKSDYVEDPTATPVVMPKDMIDGRIEEASIARVDDEIVERLGSHVLREGDIVLGRRGDIGRRAWTGGTEDGWLCGTGSIRISLNGSQGVRPRFIFYYLGLPQIIGWLEGHAVGATMSNLSAGVVQQLPIRYPPLAVQDAIIQMLDSHEALIANNRRRIEILEEMARLLYREWFVHFRFPGHERVELVDSELGPIPEGWEVERVGEAMEAVGGGTPSKTVDEYWKEGTVQWFTPTDLTRSASPFAFQSGAQITDLGLKKSSAKLFPPDSVMMTSRATIGAISISTTEAATNQGFITCLPSELLSSSYIYFWLHANVDLFHTLAGGATFKELRKSTFRDLSMLVPHRQIMGEFGTQVEPMMDLIKTLLRQNEILRQARDLRLPRLISGEFDVSELDLDLEAAGV